MPGLAVTPIFEERRTQPALRIRTITTPDEFLALEPVWHDVLRRAEIGHPFLEYAWVRTWWECFGRGNRLNILVVTAGGEPVAIAPLIVTRVRMWKIPVRCLSFFYNDHVPRADFIVVRGHEEAYEAIWNHLHKCDGWELIQLCQLTGDSPTLAHLQTFSGDSGCRSGIWESSRSPYIELHEDWTAYLEGLPAKHKSNLRNRFKRLSQEGPVEIETIESGERAAEAMQEGLRLEAAAWKRNAGTAIACDPDIARFYWLLTRRAANEGWLRLNFLRAGDSRVAFDYSLAYRERVFLLKMGYDPSFAQYSPSNLLLSLALQRAFHENRVGYDFLGDQADWKRCWARCVRRHVWLYIFPDTVKGRLLHVLKFRLVPALKAMLGWQKRGADCESRSVRVDP